MNTSKHYCNDITANINFERVSGLARNVGILCRVEGDSFVDEKNERLDGALKIGIRGCTPMGLLIVHADDRVSFMVI